MDHAVGSRGTRDSSTMAQAFEQESLEFLAPLVAWLDTVLDKRVVRALVRSIVALAEWRSRAHG